MIQEQNWPHTDRVIITDEEHHGCVIVDVIKTAENKERYDADALLWSLWVDEPYRKKGTARKLIEIAEREAVKRGCKTMALEWSREESSVWVARWYESLGYYVREFGKHSALQVKKLNKEEI